MFETLDELVIEYTPAKIVAIFRTHYENMRSLAVMLSRIKKDLKGLEDPPPEAHTARDHLLRKREDVACEGTPKDVGAEVCHHKVCDNFFTGYDNSCLQFEKAFQTLDKVCQTLDLPNSGTRPVRDRMRWLRFLWRSSRLALLP